MSHEIAQAAREKTPIFSWADLSMLCVAVIWGANFTVVKQTLSQIYPMAFASIRFSLATFPFEALCDSRRAWLREVLASASRLWRMTRVGVKADSRGQESVVTEVDLSGAPDALLEPLWLSGLAAARWVSSWLLLSVRSLCDPDLDGEVWEVLP